MIKGDYDFLKSIADLNVCAKCHSQLEVCWHSIEDSYVLGCGEHGYIDAIFQRMGKTGEWRAGAPSPEEHLAEQSNKGGNQQVTQEKQLIPFSLEGVPGHDLATGEVLSKEKMLALVSYARRYGLDPMRGHVVMMYGEPYIGIDGYLFFARSTGIHYCLESRPMTTEEVKGYHIEGTDHGWLAKVRFLDTGASFTGIGIVTYEEMTAKSDKKPSQLRSPVVAAHPWQLGQKRAEWQALRRAFPIGESE